MSGLGRFAFEVTRRLLDAGTHMVIYTPNKPLHDDYQSLANWIHRDSFGMHPFLWELFRLPVLLGKSGCSLLWSPANIGPIFPGVPHYLTLHDLTFIHDATWMDRLPRLLYRTLIPLICKGTEYLISPTEVIRQEVLAHLPEKPAGHVLMCHQGGDHVPLRDSSPPEQPLDSEKYFVFLGNIDRRKNLARIVDAWALARKKVDQPLKLYIIGAVKFKGNYSIDVEDASIEIRSNLDDAAVFALLSQARGLLFPSLYEGFGFPMLEAMRSGCPVITSNIGAMAEVAGSAALLVDPHSAQEIATAIVDLCRSDELHGKLVGMGFERQKTFTWDRTAHYYLDLFSRECR
ncbi:glycosyltransferase family 1 protein [Geobacter sp. SVR]|nr:glycosyltransferase family 1 protein [Geobacter sp. SVR]